MAWSAKKCFPQLYALAILTNTTDNDVWNNREYKWNYQTHSVWHVLRLSGRTKKGIIDGRTETKKRRICMVVIAGFTKSKRPTNAMKRRTPSKTATRDWKLSADYKMGVYLSRFPLDNKFIRNHDTFVLGPWRTLLILVSVPWGWPSILRKFQMMTTSLQRTAPEMVVKYDDAYGFQRMNVIGNAQLGTHLQLWRLCA